MLRLLFRALPFFIIVAILYKSSGWAQEAFHNTRDKVVAELTAWEMGSIESQLDFDLNFNIRNLMDYEKFVQKTYPDDVENYMRDGWGTEYMYEFDPRTKIYSLTSAGPDKDFEKTEDNIVKTNKKPEGKQ